MCKSPWRCRQHELARDLAATLAIARQWIALKLTMQRHLLAALPSPLNLAPTGEIRAALENGLAAVAGVESVAALMGRRGRRGGGLVWLAGGAVAGAVGIRRSQPATAARSGQCAVVAGLHPVGGGDVERRAGGRAWIRRWDFYMA